MTKIEICILHAQHAAEDARDLLQHGRVDGGTGAAQLSIAWSQLALAMTAASRAGLLSPMTQGEDPPPPTAPVPGAYEEVER